MKRYPGMKVMAALLFGFVLLAAACGGKQSVASKSAAAYDEAKAKGVAVGGGHEHGGHAATETATDHSAHGTAADAHAGMQHGAATETGAMDHSAHGGMTATDHAAMGHGSTAGHGAHAGMTAADHAAMGHGAHGSGSAPDQHAQHGSSTAGHAGHGTTTPAGGHDMHAGMQHGTTSPGADPHAGHTQQGAAQPDHAQHGAMQPGAASPAMTQHAGHGAPPATALLPAPRTNREMQKLRPGATLRPDAFDAPAPISVSEAAKAAEGGHQGHDMRGITPGEDRENPPTPMPATRDRTTTAPPDHSQHGNASSSSAAQPAAAVYTCPMHPEVTSDKPGTCPKCGMTLVKKN
jgi:Heavy metal binding domain